MKNTVLVIIALVLIGAFGFAIGIRFQGRISGNRVFNARQQNFYPMGRRGMTGGFYSGNLQGQISAISANNITIQRPDGSTYSVTINDQTFVNKVAQGAKSDLKTGENVTVYGSNGVGGQFNVQSILINP